MIEIYLKHNPIRQSWLIEDIPSNNLDNQRGRSLNRPHAWRPPTDVYENEEAIVVRVEISGMREEDFSIFLDEQRLVIEGARVDVPERRAYYQLEIPYGEFSTEVDLPVPVAIEGIQAIYQDGFLKIILPKARSHLIRVKES